MGNPWATAGIITNKEQYRKSDKSFTEPSDGVFWIALSAIFPA